MANKFYEDYMRSTAWRMQRDRFLNFWGHRCALCNGQKNLEVHHRTYERLGREKITDCIVLCHACHELHTNFTGNFLKQAWQQLRDGG